jgi:hypothetical protein
MDGKKKTNKIKVIMFFICLKSWRRDVICYGYHLPSDQTKRQQNAFLHTCPLCILVPKRIIKLE